MDEIEKTFIEKFGAIIIATVALIQPWIIYLWRKYLLKPKLDFFETGKIEIGFSSFASTIGFNGTIRVKNRDTFISKINLEVKKHKDFSVHNFEWAVFRDTKLNIGNSNSTSFELPYGLLLKKESPQRVNIQFHDLKQQSDLRESHDRLIKAWNDYADEEYPYEERKDDSDFNHKIALVFEKFSKQQQFIKTYEEFKSEFYWEKSKYDLKITLTSSDNSTDYSVNYQFELSEEDCERIKLNTLTLAEFACNNQKFDWNFANVDFKTGA